MRKLSVEERDELVADIELLLQYAVSHDYAQVILNHKGEENQTILDRIIQNVLDCSAWEESGYYSESDIRFAIGRVLMERIGIEY